MTNIADVSAKKKRFSKKKKESWRKRIDISDVNTFLDVQRQEERIGKISTKTNEELFHVDVKSDSKLLTARQKRKLIGMRAPRCFASLENTSKVADPISKRNKVNPKYYSKEKAEKFAQGNLNSRQKQSVADQLRGYSEKEEKLSQKAKGPFQTDVWSVGTLKEQRPEFNTQWIDRNVTEHNLCNTGTPVAAVPKSAFHKRSQLSAIPIPHPGTSYNPSLKDHQALMQLVTEREESIIRNEDHLERVTTAMFDRVTPAQRDANHLKDFNAILNEPDDDDISDSNDADTYKAVNAPVVVKKKDQKARKKMREQRELKQSLAERKLEKKKITDIHRLRHLNEDIKQEDSKLKVQRVAKEIRRLERQTVPRKIGKNSFKEEEIDLTLPQDMAGNLRNVRTEGSILATTFKNMQRRNILAPTVDLGLRRRREVKRFVRNTHKEEQLPLTKEQLKLNQNIKKK